MNNGYQNQTQLVTVPVAMLQPQYQQGMFGQPTNRGQRPYANGFSGHQASFPIVSSYFPQPQYQQPIIVPIPMPRRHHMPVNRSRISELERRERELERKERDIELRLLRGATPGSVVINSHRDGRAVYSYAEPQSVAATTHTQYPEQVYQGEYSPQQPPSVVVNTAPAMPTAYQAQPMQHQPVYQQAAASPVYITETDDYDDYAAPRQSRQRERDYSYEYERRAQESEREYEKRLRELEKKERKLDRKQRARGYQEQYAPTPQATPAQPQQPQQIIVPQYYQDPTQAAQFDHQSEEIRRLQQQLAEQQQLLAQQQGLAGVQPQPVYAPASPVAAPPPAPATSPSPVAAQMQSQLEKMASRLDSMNEKLEPDTKPVEVPAGGASSMHKMLEKMASRLDKMNSKLDD